MLKKISLLACLCLVVSSCSHLQNFGSQNRGGAGSSSYSQSQGGSAYLEAMKGSQNRGGLGSAMAEDLGKNAGVFLAKFLMKQAGINLSPEILANLEAIFQEALENNRTNKTTKFTKNSVGIDGSFTPTRTFQTADGTYCREFSINLENASPVSGNACRGDDVIWRVQ